MFSKQIRYFAAIGVCVLWAAGSGLAQYTTTSLSGTVLDPSGAPVAGAAITVEGMDNGLHQTGASGDAGNFSFPALQVGRYQISVEKPGFAKYIQTGLNLSIGQPASVQVNLQIGNISQQISVSADAARCMRS